MIDFSTIWPWLRLCLTPSIGSVSAQKLLRVFGLPEHIFNKSVEELTAVVSPAQAQALSQLPKGWEEQVYLTQSWLEESPCTRTIVMLGDTNYPANLLQLADPPLMLFIEGALAHHIPWDSMRSVAVVGSRNPSAQGNMNAQAFSSAFVDAGLCVISGLALGIDAAAHEGAIKNTFVEEHRPSAPLRTIAVLGTGLDRIYPKQNASLADRMTKQGLLISEFPLGTPPTASNFPKRNRIIAALAEGTLVVEAALQSGSLITARLTLDLGKDVYAIPGSIHAPQVKGCHALIKQGAKLVETAADVLDEFPIHWPASPDLATHDATPKGEILSGDDADDALLCALGFDPCGIDTILERVDLDLPTLQVLLLELELSGKVIRIPGGLYQRIVRT